MRYGRTDEQKRALSAGLLRVVSEATDEPPDNIFFVIREGRGINFVEHGKHLPEFVEGNANDKDLVASLKKETTHAVHRMPRRSSAADEDRSRVLRSGQYVRREPFNEGARAQGAEAIDLKQPRISQEETHDP